MNILTKICIVVLVVLVIFASAVFITKATVDPVYAKLAADQKTRAEILQVQVANDQVVLARQIQELEQCRKTALAQAQEAADNAKALQTQLALAKGDIMRLNSEKSLQELALTTGQSNIAALTNQNKLYSEQLQAAQQLASEKQIEAQKLSSDLLDLKSLYARQEKQLETLNESVAAAREEARRAGEAGTAEAGAAAPSAEQITGTVTTVRNDLASINIGSSNGVKMGEKLVIFRDGKFIGYLQVELVDASEASGIITDKVADPMQGDKVTNKLQQ